MNVATRRIARHHTAGSEMMLRQLVETDKLGHRVPGFADATVVDRVDHELDRFFRLVLDAIPDAADIIDGLAEPIPDPSQAVFQPFKHWVDYIICHPADTIA